MNEERKNGNERIDICIIKCVWQNVNRHKYIKNFPAHTKTFQIRIIFIETQNPDALRQNYVRFHRHEIFQQLQRQQQQKKHKKISMSFLFSSLFFIVCIFVCIFLREFICESVVLPMLKPFGSIFMFWKFYKY